MEPKKKKKKKSGAVAPDEFFRKGHLSIARFGKLVKMRNDMSATDHARMMVRAATHLPQVTADIDAAVQRLVQLVTETEPLGLMHASYIHMAHASMGKTAEPEYHFDDNLAHWTHEYLQNILASSHPPVGQLIAMTEDRYAGIEKEVEKIFRALTPTYFLCASAKREADGLVPDKEFENFQVQAQMYWMGVRKQRYTYHDVKHLRLFLTPHWVASLNGYLI